MSTVNFQTFKQLNGDDTDNVLDETQYGVSGLSIAFSDADTNSDGGVSSAEYTKAIKAQNLLDNPQTTPAGGAAASDGTISAKEQKALDKLTKKSEAIEKKIEGLNDLISKLQEKLANAKNDKQAENIQKTIDEKLAKITEFEGKLSDNNDKIQVRTSDAQMFSDKDFGTISKLRDQHQTAVGTLTNSQTGRTKAVDKNGEEAAAKAWDAKIKKQQDSVDSIWDKIQTMLGNITQQ